jgi:hypothetical protein
MTTAFVKYTPEGGITPDWETRFLGEHGPKMAAMLTVAQAEVRHNGTEGIVKVTFDGDPDLAARSEAVKHSATLGAVGRIEDLDEGQRRWEQMPIAGAIWRRGS